MKTLEEVIYRAAEAVVHEYLSGGNRPTGDLVDVGMIAFIYDVEVDDLYEEIDNTVAELRHFHASGE